MEGSARGRWETGSGGTSPALSRDRAVVGRRVAAFLLDTLIVVPISAGPPLVLALWLERAQPQGAAGAALGLLFVLFLLIFMFGVYSGYFVLFESYRGQTPGKMLFGIEVIRERDGRRPTIKDALFRVLLLWVADGQVSGLVGLVAMLATGKNQRLGDLVARTLVVRKRRSA